MAGWGTKRLAEHGLAGGVRRHRPRRTAPARQGQQAGRPASAGYGHAALPAPQSDIRTRTPRDVAMNDCTVEIVRARFVEACDTERRMPHGRAGSAMGYWPSYEHTFEDMAGWGTKRLAEERELRFRRTPPSSGAISRHDEVMRWTGELITDENVRRIVWAWAWCQMTGSSFSARCRKRGWVKATAYRRLQDAMERISTVLGNGRTVLRLPDEIWVRQQHPISGIHSGTGSAHRGEPAKSPTSQIFDGDRPGHTLTSPQAIDDFAKHLTDVNRRRRREQEKRRKLGMADTARP